jgi:hypothetical protein
MQASKINVINKAVFEKIEIFFFNISAINDGFYYETILIS